MSKKEYILVNLGQFEFVTRPKQYVYLMFLDFNSAKKSKRTLRASTASNKCLK